MGVMFSFFVVVQLLNYASSELEVWTSETVNLKFWKHMILDVISLEANLWFLLSKDVYKYGRLAGCTSFWSVVGQMSCKW